MAEALFNFEAKRLGVEANAESAGTMGGKDLNPAAVHAVEELGISMDGHFPKVLTQEMVDRADVIISMGCGVDAEACPAKFMLTEDWGLDDPAGQTIEVVRRIRDQVRERVVELLERQCR